jgi:hypothetical protein
MPAPPLTSSPVGNPFSDGRLRFTFKNPILRLNGFPVSDRLSLVVTEFALVTFFLVFDLGLDQFFSHPLIEHRLITVQLGLIDCPLSSGCRLRLDSLGSALNQSN